MDFNDEIFADIPTILKNQLEAAAYSTVKTIAISSEEWIENIENFIRKTLSDCVRIQSKKFVGLSAKLQKIL